MEQASFATDNLKNTAVTVEAMTSANKELKKQYKGISVDKIEVRGEEEEGGLIPVEKDLCSSSPILIRTPTLTILRAEHTR